MTSVDPVLTLLQVQLLLAESDFSLFVLEVGEAVAAGLVCESWLSVQRGLLSPEELDKIETFVFSVFDKLSFVGLETEAIAEFALQDKKNAGNTINCTLLIGIGSGVFDQPVTLTEIAEALRYYHRLQS